MCGCGCGCGCKDGWLVVRVEHPGNNIKMGTVLVTVHNHVDFIVLCAYVCTACIYVCQCMCVSVCV